MGRGLVIGAVSQSLYTLYLNAAEPEIRVNEK